MKKIKGPQDTQFTKHKSPLKVGRGSLPSPTGQEAGEDEQFDSAVADSKQAGKLPKGTPGDDMSHDGQDISPAKMIMRAVAKASQAPEKTQHPKPDKTVSSPKSKSQSKDFKASTEENEQGRSKSQIAQKVSQKKIQSKQ